MVAGKVRLAYSLQDEAYLGSQSWEAIGKYAAMNPTPDNKQLITEILAKERVDYWFAHPYERGHC